jgi:hypothetical protein
MKRVFSFIERKIPKRNERERRGSVCSFSRVQPNSGFPEFGHFADWPKSETSDFGWRAGEGVS